MSDSHYIDKKFRHKIREHLVSVVRERDHRFWTRKGQRVKSVQGVILFVQLIKVTGCPLTHTSPRT